MKKKILSAVGIALTCMALMTGCQQTMAKSFGGNMTLTLDPGQKLELITWKEDSLWYLTRPMQKVKQQRLIHFKKAHLQECLKEQ